MKDIDILIEIPSEDEDKFKELIKQKRKENITPPLETVNRVYELNKEKVDDLIKKDKLSELILLLREESYCSFLREEACFNGIILKEIARKFNTPQEVINKLSDHLFLLKVDSKEELKKEILNLIGTYTSSVTPYIYALCLSNTQSRRSRSGKVFENIIYLLYNLYNYPFDSQSKVGKTSFAERNIGKVVDSILPGLKAFSQRRDKVIIGSMKTSLRERWQEVVEEITRSNVPSIYLLTLDQDLPVQKINQISEHNIVLVVLQSTKQEKHIKDAKNIIDFETFFLEEIPNICNFWKSTND